MPAALLFLLLQAMTPGPGCLKYAFENFCLGGEAALLPKPDFESNGRFVYEKPEPTIVTLYDGFAASVARAYKPATWLTYWKLEKDLQERFGRGKDLSWFPNYANDASSREIAIAIGKGRAIRQWDEQGWSLQLKWTQRESILLVYFHDELERQRQKAAKQKF